MKMMNTEELLNILRGLTEGGSEVSMPVSGNSMEPFLKNERDRVCFRKPETPLKRGDIVFYQRSNGQYVMHRIQKIMPEAYFLVGDAQTEVEGPVRPEQIFGIVTKAQRRGKWISEGNFWWGFFAHVWISMIPLRNMLMFWYGKGRKRW